MQTKKILCESHLRKIPSRFSWIDHRLVRDKYICRCDPPALALYLFLVTVGDRDGLSYYSDKSISGLLSLDIGRFQQARQRLEETSLIVYQKPLYQVLALEPHKPIQPLDSAPPEKPSKTGRPISFSELLRRAGKKNAP